MNNLSPCLFLLAGLSIILTACADLAGCEQMNAEAYEQMTGVELPPVASADCREEGPARLTVFQLDTVSDTPWRYFGSMDNFVGSNNLQRVSAGSLPDHFPALAGDARLPTEGQVFFKSSLRGDYRYKVALLPNQSILIMEVQKR